MSKTENQHHITERPPVIVIMGHIDHGKSQLLDYIRKSNVVAGEAGGITQHTYAYEIEPELSTGEKKKMTFLDTPGHEAFTLMRERGADVADIAVLVVASDDGVKQQTLEALSIIKESKIPYIVALNKIDLPNAQPDKIRQQLSEQEVYFEGYGGNVPVVEVSAKTGAGIPELLEYISLIAQMENFTGESEQGAGGFVIEAHRDPKKGVSATLLIKNGVLEKGTFIVAGKAFTPVRRIENFLGEVVPSATFSSPVRIAGFNETPQAGSPFVVFPSKKEAERYLALLPEEDLQGAQEEILTENSEKTDEETSVTIPLIVKADMEGTLEAVLYEIKKLETKETPLMIVHAGVGAISESDVKRATGASDPLVVGFNVGIESNAVSLARQLEIPLQSFDIIYRITEWLEEEIKKRKPKVAVEETLGKAKILRVFSKVKDRQVVGGKVREGKLTQGSRVKILRRDVKIAEGKIIELQQQKVNAREIVEGSEFGAMIESREHDIAEGDYIESFVISHT